jgi:bifunctional non-homologous end joining protein LigD
MKRLEPMLASVGTDVPQGEDWVFEPKYDGIRILAFVDKGEVALVSRNGLNKTHSFPEIADALRALQRKAKRPLVIDGEIVAMRGRTPARFQALQGRMHVSDATAIAAHRDDAPTALVAFDLLLSGTKALVTEPWRARRKHLAALLQPPGRSGALRLSDVATNGERMLRDARQRGWEGIIAKRADAPYHPGRRTRDWLKLKIELRQEFVVGGWTEPRRSREHIGALLLGYHDADGQLIYAGHTGTGFTRAGLADMGKRLAKLERAKSPFTTTPRTNEKAHWVRPSVVVEVKFSEWTTDGKLRQPVFIGVRDDKDPRDVVHEPESLAPARKRKARR